MGILVVPVLITLLVLPVDHADAQRLANFDRLQRVTGHAVFVADAEGVERRLKLVRVDGDNAIFTAGANEVVMHRNSITNVDRARDASWDGAVKGAIFGVVVAGLLSAELSDNRADFYLSAVATYAGIGYLTDAAIGNRQPIYRAPAAAPGTPAPRAPTLSFSFRF
ncbi:MAG: hypothetical protein IT178_06005 [Acidobacteria bacterium]|nr:hypothetical protein [Acidobacteriota bacterium]